MVSLGTHSAIERAELVTPAYRCARSISIPTSACCVRGGGGWKRSHGWVYTGTNGETRETDKATTSRTTAPALDPTGIQPSLGNLPEVTHH